MPTSKSRNKHVGKILRNKVFTFTPLNVSWTCGGGRGGGWEGEGKGIWQWTLVRSQVVCVTRFDQSECVCRVNFALGKSRFQKYMWWNFRFIPTVFQACVGNFDTIPPWKVVGTLYRDINCVSFKYFAFLSVCDKFELLGHVQAAMMIWVLFSPFFLDSLLVTVSGFIGLFRSTCYFNLSSL